MKLSKFKGLVLILVAALLILCASVVTILQANSVYAYQSERTETSEDGEEIQPRWTNLSLSIDCGDGDVCSVCGYDKSTAD